jgi:hypothetical protein
VVDDLIANRPEQEGLHAGRGRSAALEAFDEVVPAAGSANSAMRIATERLAALSNATWVDVCFLPD